MDVFDESTIRELVASFLRNYSLLSLWVNDHAEGLMLEGWITLLLHWFINTVTKMELLSGNFGSLLLL